MILEILPLVQYNFLFVELCEVLKTEIQVCFIFKHGFTTATPPVFRLVFRLQHSCIHLKDTE